MKSPALEPVRLYCIAVALVGAAVLATLVAISPFDLDGGYRTIEFLALAGSVMIGELFPIEAPRRPGDGEISVSVMFSFALLLGVGLVPALAAGPSATSSRTCCWSRAPRRCTWARRSPTPCAAT